VKPFPERPDAMDAPEMLEEGHLWLLELVEGAPLRFELQDSGLLTFGDAHRAYSDADELPLSVQAAVRHVREQFDREALRTAVEDPTAVTFFGVATRNEGVIYDWDRLPPFLGTEIRDEDGYRPPDATEAIFERLDLHPAPALERERRARDFQPSRYAFPDSAWRDGPVAGVLIHNKRGGRAVLLNPDLTADSGPERSPEPLDATAEALAERFATLERFQAVAESLRERGWAVTVDALLDRVVEGVAREHHACLAAGRVQLEPAAFRSAVAPLARAWVDGQ
jgi:hypothetical protein